MFNFYCTRSTNLMFKFKNFRRKEPINCDVNYIKDEILSKFNSKSTMFFSEHLLMHQPLEITSALFMPLTLINWHKVLVSNAIFKKFIEKFLTVKFEHNGYR